MASPGRRARQGFAATLLAVLGLAALAVASGAGGTRSESASPDSRLAGSLDEVRGALWPLLQYVREGQPRDSLTALSAAATPEVSPEVMRAFREGATSALTNLDHLDEPVANSQETLRSIRSATALYVEAAGLAEDAADPAGGSTRIELATIGSRLLRLADALFDQGRRLGGDGFDPEAVVQLDAPEAIPNAEIGTRVRAEADKLAKTVAQPDAGRSDQGRPGRLHALAQQILQTDGGR